MSSSVAPAGQTMIWVSVTQPTICTASALAFSTAAPVPSGQVLISTDSGWGTPGSIWNFTAGNGAQLQNVKANCQGSSCSNAGQVSAGNQVSNGIITDNSDGVWSLNVTKEMQSQVMVMGSILGSGADLSLTITSTPPCALPVAQNCSSRTFNPSADQWAAYTTGDFLTAYIAEHQLTSLQALFAQASSDFLPTTVAEGLICNPDAGNLYACTPPSSLSNCDASSQDSTKGFLIVWALVRLSQVLTLLYQALGDAQEDLTGLMPSIVATFFQPAAQEKWESIVTAVAAIVGLLTFAAILLDAVTDAAATPAVVAIVVGVQSTLSAVGNIENGFTAQPADGAYLAVDGNYSQGAVDYVQLLQGTVDLLWNSTELGSSGLTSVLASGAWLALPNPLNDTSLRPSARDWWDDIMITSFINEGWKDNDVFIVFIAYGTVGYYGLNQQYNLTEDDCIHLWQGDTSLEKYVTCDIPFGDAAGMAILTRPFAEGYSSTVYADVTYSWRNGQRTWNPHDAVQSSMDGLSQHGFGYNLTDVDFSQLLQQGEGALNTFTTLPLSTPGLFNIPVCVVTDLSQLPGADQEMTDNDISNGYRFVDPCQCKTSNVTVNGQTQMFIDNVSEGIKNAVNCVSPYSCQVAPAGDCHDP